MLSEKEIFNENSLVREADEYYKQFGRSNESLKTKQDFIEYTYCCNPYGQYFSQSEWKKKWIEKDNPNSVFVYRSPETGERLIDCLCAFDGEKLLALSKKYKMSHGKYYALMKENGSSLCPELLKELFPD